MREADILDKIHELTGIYGSFLMDMYVIIKRYSNNPDWDVFNIFIDKIKKDYK